jgi:hypothetical protein
MLFFSLNQSDVVWSLLISIVLIPMRSIMVVWINVGQPSINQGIKDEVFAIACVSIDKCIPVKIMCASKYNGSTLKVKLAIADRVMILLTVVKTLDADPDPLLGDWLRSVFATIFENILPPLFECRVVGSDASDHIISLLDCRGASCGKHLFIARVELRLIVFRVPPFVILFVFIYLLQPSIFFDQLNSFRE